MCVWLLFVGNGVHHSFGLLVGVSSQPKEVAGRGVCVDVWVCVRACVCLCLFAPCSLVINQDEVCVGRVHLQQSEGPSPRGLVLCCSACNICVCVCVCEREGDGERCKYKYKGTKLSAFCVCLCVYCTSSSTNLGFSDWPLNCTSTVRPTGCEMLMWAAWLYVGLSHITPTQHIKERRAVVKDTESWKTYKIFTVLYSITYSPSHDGSQLYQYVCKGKKNILQRISLLISWDGIDKSVVLGRSPVFHFENPFGKKIPEIYCIYFIFLAHQHVRVSSVCLSLKKTSENSEEHQT